MPWLLRAVVEVEVVVVSERRVAELPLLRCEAIPHLGSAKVMIVSAKDKGLLGETSFRLPQQLEVFGMPGEATARLSEVHHVGEYPGDVALKRAQI